MVEVSCPERLRRGPASQVLHSFYGVGAEESQRRRETPDAVGVRGMARVGILYHAAQQTCHGPRGEGVPRRRVVEQVILGNSLRAPNIVLERPDWAQWVWASPFQEGRYSYRANHGVRSLILGQESW